MTERAASEAATCGPHSGPLGGAALMAYASSVLSPDILTPSALASTLPGVALF